MPEAKHERLSGQVSETSSSDASIRAVIEGLDREIKGLPKIPLIIEGEPLKPVSTIADLDKTQGIIDKFNKYKLSKDDAVHISEIKRQLTVIVKLNEDDSKIKKFVHELKSAAA